MLRWAETEEDITHSAMAMLFLVTYVFLLRLPSEALPIEVGRVPGKQQQAVLEMDEGKLILTLMRRKNRPAGSKLERTCWCKESCRTCPVHVLGPAVRGIQPGTALFGGFAAAGANSALKDMLGKIGASQGEGVPDARHSARTCARSSTLRCFCIYPEVHAVLAPLCVCGRSPTLEDLGSWRVALSSFPRVHGYPSFGKRRGCTGVSFATSRTRVERVKRHFTFQAHADESGSDSD